MILRIDHVGLVTDDPAGVGAALSVLGLHPADAGLADDYGVACEFWECGGSGAGGGWQPAIELVAPARADSAVTGHLARKGPGLYHVAFEVDDVECELARLRENGFVAVDRTPCAGARAGMRVAFVYLRRPAGLLIELVQYESATDSHRNAGRSGS